MRESECMCERLYETICDGMRDDLRNLNSRVGRLETVLGRGMLLLIANLLAVVASLVTGTL